MATPEISCPKCGSNQFTANKKGFSVGKAVVGDILVGPIGLLGGALGSNKVIITCLNCGNTFKPGDSAKAAQERQTQAALAEAMKNPIDRWVLIISYVAVIGFMIYFGKTENFFFAIIKGVATAIIIMVVGAMVSAIVKYLTHPEGNGYTTIFTVAIFSALLYFMYWLWNLF